MEPNRSRWEVVLVEPDQELANELGQSLSSHGFDVLELHDGPGPRTEPPWQEGRLPGTRTDADRLHLVARLRTA